MIQLLGKSPNSWIVTPREFCNARKWQQVHSNKHVIVERSCEHANVPPAQGYIRAHIAQQVIELEATSANACMFKQFTVMNMGGWIPTWFFSFAMSQIPQQFVTDLHQIFERFAKQKN